MNPACAKEMNPRVHISHKLVAKAMLKKMLMPVCSRYLS